MNNTFEIFSASVSDRGLSDKRPQNEDSYLELPGHGVFAVADGVGGAMAGDVASQMAVEIIGEAFVNRPADGDAEDTMRQAIERANSAIYQMASDLPQLTSMATTVVALHIEGDVATIGHVGDSRLYRSGPDGRLWRETDDHSVVEEEVRAGRMTPEQALNHPSRNVISRALGAEPTVNIDLKTIMVTPGTRFLLCSDGITRHIDDQELSGLLFGNEDADIICDRMKTVCYDRGAEDNLTAVIVTVGSRPEMAESPAAVPASELEEVTVASARSPFDSKAEAESEPEFPEDLSPISPAEEDHAESLGLEDEEAGFETIEMRDTAPEPQETEADQPAEYASTSVVVPAAEPPTPAPQPASFQANTGSSPASRSGSMVLPAIAFLVLGILVGAGGMYFMQQGTEPEPAQIVEPPVITEMKSTNTALTAFEEGRRQVDSDPQKYIKANAATPQEAEDFFLLGRAYLMAGEYWAAKREFTEARKRLPQVEADNAKTLAAEIAMALAIIESASASERFSKEITAANPVGITNTNSSEPNP